MIDFKNFKIKRGPSDVLKNPLLIIEEGCWYLSTDTAELYVGIIENDTPVLKRVNGDIIPEVDLSNYYNKSEVYTKEEVDALLPHEEIEEVKTTVQTIVPTIEKVEVILPKVEEEILPAVETVAELRSWVENKDYLQDIDLNGYATEIYVNNALANYQSEAELYKVDFNNPNYTEAKAAYEAGKVLVLINAAPDVNSYAMMNYVSDTYITFTKFLMSRSETCGAFNTYYLKNDNTWEVAKEVKLNKVEITAEGNLQIGKQLYKTPSVDGLATEEYVNKKIAEAELNDKEIDLEAYYTKSEVDAKIPNIENLATKEEVRILENNVGFVKVDDRSLVEVIDETFAKKEEIPSVDGLVSKDYVDNAIANIEHPTVDLSEYATKEEIKTLDNSIGFIPLDNRTMCQVIDDTYATKESVEEAINNINIPTVDLKGYATEDYVDSKVAGVIIPDVTNFVTMADVEAKGYINEIPAEYITEEELDSKGYLTQHQDLTDYAKKEELFSKDYNDLTNKPEIPSLEGYAKLEDVPEVDNFVTNDELNSKGYLTEHQNIEHKANNILFSSDMFVTKEFGNFKVGDTLKGMPITEILTKLLGLSDVQSGDTPEQPEIPGENATPEEIINYLINNRVHMYSQDTNGVLTETPFSSSAWTEQEAAVNMDGISTVYNIKDNSGTIIESGYQEATDYNEEAWLTVALPEQIKNVKVKMYDSDVNDWVEMNWNVVPAEEQTIEGYTIWTVPEDYEVTSGDTYRFVIV